MPKTSLIALHEFVPIKKLFSNNFNGCFPFENFKKIFFMLSGSFGISEGAHNSQNTRKQHIKKIVSFATKTNQM